LVSSRRLWVVALVFVAAGQVGRAQQPPTQAVDPLLTQARRAFASGQGAIALRTIEPLLARTPGDHAVIEFAIQVTLSLEDGARASAIYDSYVQATGVEAADLLKPIALNELRRVVSESANDPRLRTEALERLARNGDARAAADLRQPSTPGRQALLVDATLARLGDRPALQRLADATSSADYPDKSPVAEAIGRSGDPNQGALLVPLLHHRDPYTRMAAVDGVVLLSYKAAVPDLRQLLSDPTVEVRSRAARALTGFGDSAGRDIIEKMLHSPVADVRLMAVEADPSMTASERLLVLRPILFDSDPLVRAKAAELLARDDPAAAKPVLEALMHDPDMAPRREAARVLETLKPPDIGLYRRLMTDKEPWVRMYAASAVVTAATSGPSKAPGVTRD
jgi:HEAT repeat protein